MKKLVTLFIALAVTFAVKAQWVNNPATNTFLANTSADAGEVYLAKSPNGDTYIQWSQFGPNSWSPSLQRLNATGEPQWGNNGIHPSYHQMASWSQGFAMAATTDNAVVTCFATEAGQTIAIKINADGTYAWGEQGLTLFGGAGNSRTELLAGDDGGVWALGTDTDTGKTYVCYIEANGTMNPTIAISDDNGKLCMFGLMIPADDGGVFVVYEKETYAYTYFYEKEIWVEGYRKNGESFSAPTRLMAPQTFAGSYCHYVVPDGIGGGYVYLWHPAIGGSFNVYVFHFDQYGASTITDINGVPAHVADPNYLFIDANATVDPISHDLIITYIQTDAQYQTQCQIYVNRISITGEKPWGDGHLVIDNGTTACSDLLIDAIPYGYGFILIYNDGDYYSTIKAKGFDQDCNELWSTLMCSQDYPKAMCKNTTGFDSYQNVVAWVDNTNNGTGGLYGQNLGWEGTMGQNITPIPPVSTCYPPYNFWGEVTTYNGEEGIMLYWTAPETQPLHYNIINNILGTLEIGAQYNSCFNPFQGIFTGYYFTFRLTAVYEDCESDYALTPEGEDIVIIVIDDSVIENDYEPIVNVVEIYNVNGQSVNGTDIQALSQGMYIVKGMTESGKTVVRKIVR